jgi:1-acyl-sn-glycerol-3-phosphate acyltransferase
MKWFYWLCWGLVRFYLKVFCRLQIIGEENIPMTGGVIIAANHIGAGDPPFIAVSVKREVYFLAKRELFENFLLGTLIKNLNAIPVIRGVLDQSALGKVEASLKKGYGLLLFPEGTRSRTGELRKGKPGVGLLARRTLSPIIPTYIENSRGFAKLIFGGKRLKIRFGEPISRDQIASYPDDKEGYRAIAELLMTKIEALGREYSEGKVGDAGYKESGNH